MSKIKDIEYERALEQAILFSGVPKCVYDSTNGPIGLYEVEKNVYRCFLVADINRKKSELGLGSRKPHDFGWFTGNDPEEKE